MNVDVENLHSCLEKIRKLVKLEFGSYVCVSNVHMCMETFDCDVFKAIVKGADMVIPDGKLISWAQKLLGFLNQRKSEGKTL
jgi:N-acetylglucosaminyldiphosphoundecaprenol N-acetyl-beta-D-mannosaminyltransferase